ncbi:NAD(P)-dependent oxidoreductase [Coprobacter sp.]
MKKKKKVLVTYNMFRSGYAELIEKYDVTFPPEGVESFTYDEVLRMIPEYDALQSMFNFPVDRRLMDAGINLKIISNYAVGYDNVDISYATQKGIQVTNTPDPVTEPTADQAMGLLLAVSRRISELDRRLRFGAVKVGLLDNLGHSLYGSTIGIIGMGRIGQALARRAVAAGMKVVYYNRHQVTREVEEKYGAKYLSLDELLCISDVVSINAPHTSETHHLIGERELSMMKSSSILINTARGPLVDEKALVEALRERKIWGAGLDVFEFGDYPSEELLKMDNVVLNPHTGTQTFEVRNEMAAYVSKNIIHFFEGGPVAKVNRID